MCKPCDELSSSDSVLNIIESANDDERHLDKNLPDYYLTAAQLKPRQAKRREREGALRLALLGKNRKLNRTLSVLADYKRIQVLLSTKNIPRVHQLFRTMLKNGRGPQRIIESLEAAIAGMYHPKGYDLDDFDDTFLALKLGSAKLLYAQNKSRGLASESALLRNKIFKIPRFVMESGALSTHIHRVMLENLLRFAWIDDVNVGAQRCLWNLEIDDVNSNRRENIHQKNTQNLEILLPQHSEYTPPIIVAGACDLTRTNPSWEASRHSGSAAAPTCGARPRPTPRRVQTSTRCIRS